MLTECGVPAELLPEQAAAERWPFIDFTGVGPVMYHAEAGVIDPDRAIAAMLRLAAADGADVRFDTPVEKLAAAPSGGAVAITEGETFTAPVVVVAAGAWIAPLLDGLVELPTLTVTQQQVFHFAPARRARGRAVAGLHPLRRRPATSTGCPAAATAGRPARSRSASTIPARPPPPQAATSASTRPPGTGCARSSPTGCPASTPPPANEASCLYTWTANEDFILDRPGGGPFVVASPCSGHGAKFAPLLGEIIADLAAGRPAPDPRFTLAAHLAQKP